MNTVADAMTVEEILEALASGDFDALVDASEDGAIDFKREPYPLDREDARFELAKDVASFAEAAGTSIIVFPIETKGAGGRSQFERAVRARPLAKDRIDEKQIRRVIKSHVYPTVRGLEVRTFDSPDDSDKCVLAIVVPEQREADKPFLVLSPLGTERDTVHGWLIGMPTRVGDDTDHVRPSELHELIRSGRTVSSRLDQILEVVARPRAADEPTAVARSRARVSAQPPATATAGDELSEIQRLAEAFGREPDGTGGSWIPPLLVLWARPIDPTSVPSLFRETGVRQILESPPVTRHEGWNLTTLDRAEIVGGSALELRNGRRKQLVLSEDARFVAVARMIDFLARDRTSAKGERPVYKLNPLALIEYLHDFALTYKALADYFEPRPTRIRFGATILSAIGTQSGDLFLPRGGVESFGWHISEGKLPDGPTFRWSYETELENDAGAIVLPVIERIYAFFKNTAESIPYLNDDRTAVDPKLFGGR